MIKGEPMRGFLYRLVMRIAHRYHWHYAPPIYPDGDTQLWCKWCGFRQTISKQVKDPKGHDDIEARRRQEGK
jgi:hypothetical protein